MVDTTKMVMNLAKGALRLKVHWLTFPQGCGGLRYGVGKNGKIPAVLITNSRTLSQWKLVAVRPSPSRLNF